MPRKMKETKELSPALPVSKELPDQLVTGPMTPGQFENMFRGLKKAVTVITDDGAVRLEVPRDRVGTFEPQLIPKHERRLEGFNDKIIAMYARGMTVREIQGYLAEMYGVEVSPEFISKVSDAVLAEVTTWQSRPLEPVYPVVFFDALRVKIREDAVVRNKAIYLALGYCRTAPATAAPGRAAAGLGHAARQ